MQRTLHYVLQQSALGHHPLFDARLIRSAFRGRWSLGGVLDETTAATTSELIDQLGREAGLAAQRAVIARAPEPVQEVFVQLYFHYLDRFMQRRGVVYH